jgi:nucleotide-binding universal stress UspA family protein
MMRRFLVPLDGSTLAERALPYAIRLAQATQGGLVLTRVALAPPPRTLDGVDWEREQTEAVAEAHEYLRTMAESVSGQVNAVEIATPYGRPVEQIVETTQNTAADAVVMATHGRTGLSHLLYGSVTEGVLARSSVPVLAVYARPGEAPAAPFSPTSARFLVPQNGSEYDEPALQTALDLAGPQSEIVLITVVEPPQHVQLDESGRHVLAYLDQQEEASTREAREYLARVIDGVRAKGAKVPLKVDVRLGDPAAGIEMAAIDAQADLVVMATHGRTGVRRAVLGSVAGTVLRMGNTPVMLVHPHVRPVMEATEATRETAGPIPTF